jgi:hypothetical protein
MKKKDFLTVRWNNLLSLGLGVPTLIYVAAALSTSIWPLLTTDPWLEKRFDA